MLDYCYHKLLTSLQEIASNIEIKCNFCICHPNYQPFALPTKVVERFQHNSEALQHKYLSLILRNFLYGIYYNGSLQKLLSVNATSPNFYPHQSLEKNSMLGIDWQFYEQLHASNHGTGYFNPGWQILKQEPDGSFAVTKGGLTLHVEPNQVKAAGQYARIGDLVTVWLPQNRLHNRFYEAVSNVVGEERQGNPDTDLGIGRIYFNLTPNGAIALMDSLTLQLNAAAIPFSFKVLYNPSEYECYDSGVLYFEHHNYPALRTVLQSIYAELQCHFKPEIPLFTKFLAPGLSLAEEPSQKFAAQENFGMNRCQIVANALLAAWQKGQNSSEERIRVIRQHFARLGVDLHRPYLNPTSEDIYLPLN